MKISTPIRPKVLKAYSHENISILQASSNYSYLTLKNGSRVLSSYPLGYYELILKENFLRIDRSHLVNFSFIAKLVTKDKVHYIKLKDESELAIPRRKTASVISKFSGYQRTKRN